MAATTKSAAKKIDPALCRWGEGRYGSPKSARSCREPRNPKRQLCDSHEAAYRKAKKPAKAASG